MSTELTTITTSAIGVPAPLGSEAMLADDESYQLISSKLQAMIASGALPKDIKSPMQAAIMIQHGARYGLTALESLQSITMVMGQPSMKARAMGELILRHYGADAFRIVDLTPKQCIIKVQTPDGEKTVSYTMEQAAVAGLAGKDMWKKWPAELLRAKAIRDMRHTYFPALGMLTETEIAKDSVAPHKSKVTLGDLA